MSLQTHVAHCGACSGLMIMTISAEGVWFVCLTCGEETPPRPTAAEADLDVVWVPVQPARKERA